LDCNDGRFAMQNGRYGSVGRALRQDLATQNVCQESREGLAAFLFRKKQNAFFSE